MYLSSLLACQGWYYVNSYCVFFSPFPPLCVPVLSSFHPALVLVQTLSTTCTHSSFRLALALVQTLSTVCTHSPFHSALTLMLSLGICALANAVYSVHTHFLSLGTHTHVNTVYKLYVLCVKSQGLSLS